jgi:5-methylcytosine-specific restriction endonuclease McrA
MGDYQNILIIVASIGIFIFIVHMTIFEIIKKKTVLYRNLKELNKKYELKNKLQKQKELFQSCKTKSEFGKTDFDECLKYDIRTKTSKYDSLINSNEEARQRYKSYVKEYNALIPKKLSYIANFKFKDIRLWIINFYENLIFKTYKLKPFRYTKVKVKISYRSPQGQKYYKKEYPYSYDELKVHYDRVKENIKLGTTRQNIIRIERAKVTPSLRTLILKRDNYTCKHCGATIDDGVSLHIDHIIPVSKGGKTEESNLQTLCDWCNLGKSDKDN